MIPSKPFWALRIHGPETAPYAKLLQMNVDELTPGEVVIETHYSSVNFKDALAATGKGRILKKFPLNGGIDAAGIVLHSIDPRFQPGQKVLVTGSNSGEMTDGGYSEVMRARAEAVVPLPEGLTMREAMMLGTAGFTAAQCLYRMERNGQTPALGPILITGASGGVGSLAVQIFAQQGYEVVAASGKHEAIKFLQKLGASQVVPPEELGLGDRPLERARFGGAIDNVGGKMLSKLMTHVQIWGNVACVGLAESAELHATVMPLILRGVSLIGISSNNTPMDIRLELWRRLAGPWRPKHLEECVSRTVGLKDLPLAFEDILHRRVRGRILVSIREGE